jgi:hypothetical protein
MGYEEGFVNSKSFFVDFYRQSSIATPSPLIDKYDESLILIKARLNDKR